MPYANLKEYTSVRILKKVHKKVANYANLSEKPVNVALMELILAGLNTKVVDNLD